MRLIIIFLLLLSWQVRAEINDDFIKELSLIENREKFINQPKVEFNFSDDNLHTPAFVEYDFQQKQCYIKINKEVYQKSDFIEYWQKKFFIYHEIAHCVFFEKAPKLWFASSIDNSILSDFFYLEFFRPPSIEEPQLNGYDYMHETYADIYALLMIYNQGVPMGVIKSILKTRDNYFDLIHKTDIPENIFDNLSRNLNKEQENQIILKITGTNMINLYCENYFSPELKFKNLLMINLQAAREQQKQQQKVNLYTKVDRDFYKKISLIIGKGEINNNYKLFNIMSKYWENYQIDFVNQILKETYSQNLNNQMEKIDQFIIGQCQQK